MEDEGTFVEPRCPSPKFFRALIVRSTSFLRLQTLLSKPTDRPPLLPRACRLAC